MLELDQFHQIVSEQWIAKTRMRLVNTCATCSRKSASLQPTLSLKPVYLDKRFCTSTPHRLHFAIKSVARQKIELAESERDDHFIAEVAFTCQYSAIHGRTQQHHMEPRKTGYVHTKCKIRKIAITVSIIGCMRSTPLLLRRFACGRFYPSNGTFRGSTHVCS